MKCLTLSTSRKASPEMSIVFSSVSNFEWTILSSESLAPSTCWTAVMSSYQQLLMVPMTSLQVSLVSKVA